MPVASFNGAIVDGPTRGLRAVPTMRVPRSRGGMDSTFGPHGRKHAMTLWSVSLQLEQIASSNGPGTVSGDRPSFYGHASVEASQEGLPFATARSNAVVALQCNLNWLEDNHPTAVVEIAAVRTLRDAFMSLHESDLLPSAFTLPSLSALDRRSPD